MKQHHHRFQTLFSCGLALVFLMACQASPGHDHAHDDHDHDHAAEGGHDGHEEETQAVGGNFVMLDDEQVEAIDLAYGTIARKPLTATLRANGSLRVPNDHKALVTSLYGGVVQSLDVQLGATVRKGQRLATVAHPRFLELQQEYLETSAKITFAEAELRRQKDLNEGNAGARRNLELAEAELGTMRARQASLKRQLTLLGVDPASLRSDNLSAQLAILSPIAGSVSAVFAQIGSYADVNAPIAEIVDNRQLHLDLQVFEKDLDLVRIGQPIRFMLTNNPGREYEAEVFSIGSAFEDETRSIPIHCRVEGDKRGLIDGMNITGIVSVTESAVTAVPTAAIIRSEGKEYIFILADATEAGIEVPAGEQLYERIEVVSGVTEMGYTGIAPVRMVPEGARLVVKGAFFLNAVLSGTAEHSH